MKIRTCTPGGAGDLHRIYPPYVAGTAISFEVEAPSVEEFRERTTSTLKKYPYLVAGTGGKIAGYAYAGAFKARAAYSHCLETSIYVDRNERRKGNGAALYLELERIMPSLKVRNMNACIAWAPAAGENLDNGSEASHIKMGYSKVAHSHKCGFKLGKYYDIIWMEKILDWQ